MTRGLVIAAPASGSGKTMVTLSVLRQLRNAGVAVGSAKVGPDYIDGAFHRAAGGRPRFHLTGAGDTVFMFLYQDANVPRLKRDFERAGARVIEARTLPRAEALAVDVLPGDASDGG